MQEGNLMKKVIALIMTAVIVLGLCAYDFQCYESHLTVFAKGTAEEMHAKYVEMLGAIK